MKTLRILDAIGPYLRMILFAIIGFIIFFSATWFRLTQIGASEWGWNPYAGPPPMMTCLFIGSFGMTIGAFIGLITKKSHAKLQKYIELNLRKLKSQLNKEREDKEAKLAVSMSEIRLSNPGAYYRNLLKIQDNYIQNLLNAFFDTVKTSLFNEQKTIHEDYFDTLKKEATDLVTREVDIISSRTLTGFQRDGSQGTNSVDSHLKQKMGIYRDSINNRIDILKEEFRLEKSKSLPAKPPEILQNIKWFWLHGTKNWKYIILAILVLSSCFVLKHC